MNLRSLKVRLVLWYALALGAVMGVAGILIYLGVRQYLERSLGTLQSQRAQRITVALQAPHLTNDMLLREEIVLRFAPEATSRFVRVRRPDGSVLYSSGPPADQSFAPNLVPLHPWTPGTWKEELADDVIFLRTVLQTEAPGQPRLTLETGDSLVPALVELQFLLLLLTVGFLVLTTIALVGGYFLVRNALRPVDAITSSAENITSGNLSQRLPVPATSDEFAHLSEALNRMISRLDEAFQYKRRFLTDASHELRTPLTVLRGELEGMVQDPRIALEFRERMGSSLEEVERLSRIVEGLLAIARTDSGKARGDWTTFDLAEVVSSTADQMGLLAEDKGIRVVVDTPPVAWVEGDRARWKQVVVNLLDNAIKYTSPGGTIELGLRGDGGKVALTVADTGIGIPPEALPHVFERFFRVDKARSRDQGGTGLGLSIVRSICAAHGTQVEVQSVLGQGSTFRVELPRAQAPAAGA